MMYSPVDLKSRFEDYLQSLYVAPVWDTPLYSPMRYILEMKAKRIRPVLLLLSYQAFSGRDATEALGCAAAVELFHNFSLIHDDIMDESAMRRGKETVHLKWNENVAILSGDGMFALAMDFVLKDFPGQAHALGREFSRISVGVCEGQMEDMGLEGKMDASVDAYIEMIRKKTAMLMGGSMSLGALAAGADQEWVEKIYQYGELLGIGFQLHDDLMDVYAEQDKFGKRVGGDILQRKMTYLLIRALELASGEQRAELLRLVFEGPDARSLSEADAAARVAAVREIYDDLSIRQETSQAAEGFFARASTLGRELSQIEGFQYIESFLGMIQHRSS